MNETQDRPPQDDQQDGFDANRLRTISDMRRSRDDRVVAGVCAGAAKYLNIDPVVVRVIIAVLTFVGLSGLILYVAAWFLLPAEGSESSIAADWFNLDKNEEQVRIVGLVTAAVLAALAIFGDNSWNWWGITWVLIPLGILYWVFIVWPRRRALLAETASLPAPTDDTVEMRRETPAATALAPDAAADPGTRRSSSLTVLTLSIAAIAVAATVLIAQAQNGTPWTTYVAVALGVVAVGLLTGTLYGQPGPLIPIGILLVTALGIGSMLPSAGIGERTLSPLSAADVVGSYEHGLGTVELDLTTVSDPAQLVGSTVAIENGMGEIRVIVPRDLNVAVNADLWAGEIRAFDRKVNGTDNHLNRPASDPAAPALTLQLDQTFGNITVVTR